MKVALSCLPVLLIVVAALIGSADAWSYSQLRKASQMIARTRRDPITMPTNTPMVPYMVSVEKYCNERGGVMCKTAMALLMDTCMLP